MAKIMKPEERASALEAYNPAKHLIKIKSRDGGVKDYYPAAWRLYELNLRYECANFTSEIVFMDCERDLVIVKCRLFIGPDFEMSGKKTEAMKSGKLSQLDKVETAAKARCARDIGIGTEYALDMDDPHDVPVKLPLNVQIGKVKQKALEIGVAKDATEWKDFLSGLGIESVKTQEDVDTIIVYLDTIS